MVGTAQNVKHPARFSDALFPYLREPIEAFTLKRGREPLLLDPFAGTGRIFELADLCSGIIAVELEPEWVELARTNITQPWCHARQGDATNLPAEWTDIFDIWMSSVTYGNRMADSHTPGPNDPSRRITYTHSLGRKLHERNTGRMQWGPRYRHMHVLAYLEAARVLSADGLLVLNIRDHIRGGEVQPVTQWHVDCLHELGFQAIESRRVETPGMRFGANRNLRLDHEWVLTLRAPHDGRPNLPTPTQLRRIIK